MAAAAVLGPLERLFPAHPRRLRPARALRLDLAYWFLATRTLTAWAVALALTVVLTACGRPLDDTLLDGFGPVARQPVWLQTAELLVLVDLLDYWTHRAFHARRLWRFHAVHHSPDRLTWLAAARVHPVNELATRLCQVVPLAPLGFSARGAVAAVPVLFLYVVFLHADLRWDFGPLRRVLVSPAYHRWHHASDPEALDTNFAGLLPVWDVLFGTYHFPRRPPERYGVTGDPVPETLAGQLLYPFRRPPAEAGSGYHVPGRPARAVPAPGGTGMPKILIVEDNPDHSDSLGRSLERRGFEVVVAADGVEGVAASLAETPDLILMGVDMPNMGGLEATRLVKADPRTAHLPVVVVTAHALGGDEAGAAAAGCDGYFTRPLDLAALTGRIEALLSRRPAAGGQLPGRDAAAETPP